MLKRGDVVQRVTGCDGYGRPWYGVVTKIREDGAVDVLSRSAGLIYSGLWERGTFVQYGDTYDLTELDKVFRGWGE